MTVNKYKWREATISDWDFLVNSYADVADPGIGQLPFNNALKPQFEKNRMPLVIDNYSYPLRYYYIIEKVGDCVPLGILINSVDSEKQTEEFGVVIPKRNQNKGVGGSVMKDFLAWRRPLASRITCLVAKSNAVSIKLFTMLGGIIIEEKVFSRGDWSLPVFVFCFK